VDDRLYRGVGRAGSVSAGAGLNSSSLRNEAKNGKNDVVAAAGNKFGTP
jgi:hypothetical protein